MMESWAGGSPYIRSMLLTAVSQLQNMMAYRHKTDLLHRRDKSEFASMHGDEMLKRKGARSALNLSHFRRSRAVHETLGFKVMQHNSHNAISVHDRIVEERRSTQ